jgi:hypothetical protein
MLYQDLRTWSPSHDAYVHRISVVNARGGELFMLIVEDCPRRELRARKAAAVEALVDHLDAAWEQGIEAPDPGEVKVAPGVWAKMIEKQMREMARAEQPKVHRAGAAA